MGALFGSVPEVQESEALVAWVFDCATTVGAEGGSHMVTLTPLATEAKFAFAVALPEEFALDA
jgi:hypothetical protein